MPIPNNELIKRVQINPVIWRSSHPLHMNRAVLRRFWQGLAEEFGENESKLRKRWKHFKDQFRKEYKKLVDKSITDCNISWQYFEPLSFLKEDIEQKDNGAFFNNDDDVEDSDDDMPLKKARLDKIRSGRCVKKVMSNPKLDIILKRVKETKAIVEERLTDYHTMNRNDPDFLFLMSLLPSMKQLTEIQKLQFKGKMNEWLLQEITMNTYGKNVENYVCISGIKTEDTSES